MYLSRLKIKNFRVIREADLILPDQVIGVVGPNGAGKSSLVEAIAWALYGNPAARTGKEEIKSRLASGADDCEVSLEFSIRDERYRVVRRLAGRRDRTEVQLFRGEAAESVGVSETGGYLAALLGLDLKGFQTSFLAQQSELNALSDLQPARRRDHLAGMLGIGRLDRAIGRVKDDTRLAGSKVEFMERQLAGKAQLVDRLAEATQALADLNRHEGKVTTAEAESRETLKAAAANLETAQNTRNMWEHLNSQRLSARQNQADLAVRTKALAEEVERLEAAKSEKAELEKEIEKLSPTEDRLAALDQARQRLAEKTRLAGQSGRLQDEVDRLAVRLNLRQGELNGINKALAQLPPDIDDSLKRESERLEAQREEFNRLRADRTSVDRELGKLNDQLAAVAEFGPESVCDRCGRAFGDDLEGIREHLSCEVGELTEKLAGLDRTTATMTETGLRLRHRVDELTALQKQLYEFTVQHAAKVEDVASLTSLLKERREALVALKSDLDHLGEVSFDQGQYEQVTKDVERLRQGRSRRDHLAGVLQRLPRARQEHVDSTQKETDIRQSLVRFEAEIRQIGHDPEAFAAAQGQLAAAQTGYERGREALATFRKEKELVQQQLESLIKQKDELRELEDELEEGRTDRYHGEKLVGLMADFRKHLISSIRPTLARLSGELFSQMTTGKYNFIELDENYNLRILDSGQFYGIDRFSGGEKDLANLCLRLAISKALTESAGLDRSFVILDEVFGSQDNERKELILDALGGLKSHFPQILLITHIEDVKDRVEQVIEVRPVTHGFSEVWLNGELV